jgi:hypothetical protein
MLAVVGRNIVQDPKPRRNMRLLGLRLRVTPSRVDKLDNSKFSCRRDVSRNIVKGPDQLRKSAITPKGQGHDPTTCEAHTHMADNRRAGDSRITGDHRDWDMDYPAVSIGANGPSVTQRGPSVRILLESR